MVQFSSALKRTMYDFKNSFFSNFLLTHRAKYIFSRDMFCLYHFRAKIHGVCNHWMSDFNGCKHPLCTPSNNAPVIYLNSLSLSSSAVMERPPCCIHPGETPVSSSSIPLDTKCRVYLTSPFQRVLPEILFIIAAECHVVPHVNLKLC